MSNKKASKSAAKKVADDSQPKSGQPFAGLKLFFAGRPERYGASIGDVKMWAREAGASVQTKLAADTDLFVELSKGATANAIKEVAKLNQQNAAIVTLSERDFFDRFIPSADEVIELIREGSSGRKQLAFLLERARMWQSSVGIDLSNADLRGLDLSELNMSSMNLAGADLSETKLYSVETGPLNNVRLENANGEYFKPASLHHCNCRGAQLQHMGLYSYGQQKKVVGCDFTEANLDDAFCSYETIESTTFKRAILTKMDLNRCTFSEVDFSEADLSHSNLSGSKCHAKVSFEGAKLVGADCIEVNFNGADLRQADFTGARLNQADFTNAKVAGANFANAILFGAIFARVDTSKALNLIVPPFTKVTLGNACRELAAATAKAQKLTVQARVKLPEGEVTISATGSSSQAYLGGSYRVVGLTEEPIDDGFRSTSFENALEQLGQIWGHGQLQFDTIETSTIRSPLKGKALKDLAMQALSEVFNAAPPTEEQLKAKKQKVKQSQNKVAEEILAELRGGRKGVLEFNKRSVSELTTKHKLEAIRKEDFSGANLGALRIQGFGFTHCSFDKATLKKANLNECDLRKSTFRQADLSSSELRSVNLSDSDLTGANLAGANLANAVLNKATFESADLTGAILTNASLLGAQLATAKLTKIKWKSNAFDEATTFPAKFKIPEHFEFVGKGDDPRIATEAPVKNVQDFPAFMKKLEEGVDKSRLAKSLKMLKAERFELFSDVTDEAIVGVVKSQTDRDLVYSCRLTSGGEFCCCTQNLNPCGGLRGALCKHLLVLLIGLTKGDALSPTFAATWARASGRRKPALDKDGMTEILLKYKGAEAGEVDWRPTETVPEDYYAF